MRLLCFAPNKRHFTILYQVLQLCSRQRDTAGTIECKKHAGCCTAAVFTWIDSVCLLVGLFLSYELLNFMTTVGTIRIVLLCKIKWQKTRVAV